MWAPESDYPHLHRAIDADDEEPAEYLVPVRWIVSFPTSQAFSEVGLFGNQNTVCKPATPKWEHTVARLKQAWEIDESW